MQSAGGERAARSQSDRVPSSLGRARMIGVFDSGIGGLTVLRALKKELPEYSFIYFGDTARTPYGSKSPETILKYGREDAAALLALGAKMIVIACNTVSAAAALTLRQELGVPVFEVIAPAAASALLATKNKRIGVIGTRSTIGSGAYQKMLSDLSGNTVSVTAEACPLFVPLVEEGWEETPEASAIVKKSLNRIKSEGIDTLILGCTHYPLLRKSIEEEIGSGVTLVDSAGAVALEIKKFLKEDSKTDNILDKTGKLSIFVSDKTSHVSEIAGSWLGSGDVQKLSL